MNRHQTSSTNTFDRPPAMMRRTGGGGGRGGRGGRSNNSNSNSNHQHQYQHTKVNEKKRKVSSIQSSYSSSSSSTSTSNTTHSNSNMIEEMPGYYYDKEKDRYFKITRENRKQAEAAMKQLKIDSGQLIVEEKKEFKNDKHKLKDDGGGGLNHTLLQRELLLFGSRKCLSCKLKQLYVMDKEKEELDEEDEERSINDSSSSSSVRKKFDRNDQFKFFNTSGFTLVEPLIESIPIKSKFKDEDNQSDKQLSVSSGLICINHRTGTLGTFWIGIDNQQQQQQDQSSTTATSTTATTTTTPPISLNSSNYNITNHNFSNDGDDSDNDSSYGDGYGYGNSISTRKRSNNKLSLFLNLTTEKSTNSLISSIKSFPFKHGYGGLAISYLGGEGCSGIVKVFSPNDHDELFTYELDKQNAWTVEWHPSGKMLAIGESGRIHFVDSIRGQLLKTINLQRSDIFSLDFNQSGNLLASGSRDGKLRLFDIRVQSSSTTESSSSSNPYENDHTTPLTSSSIQYNQINNNNKKKNNNQQQHQQTQQLSPICSLKFLSNDDNYMIVSTMNGRIVKWDRRIDKEVLEYQHHRNSHSLLRISVSEDNQFLSSGGEDKCIRLWDLNSGHLLRTLGPFNNIVQSTSIVNYWFDEESNMCSSLGTTSLPTRTNQNSLVNPFEQTTHLQPPQQQQQWRHQDNPSKRYYYEPVLCFNVNDGLILSPIY